MGHWSRVLAAALIAILCLGAASTAEVPKLLSYQGVLTNASGVAVSDGSYDLAFKLYTTQYTVVPPVWEETQTLQVTKGIFNALLGKVTPIDPQSFNVPLYLGVAIEGEAELPRVPLTSSPFSLGAASVSGAANVFPSSGNVGIGTTSPGYPLHVVSSSGQVGLHVTGNDMNWASIYISANQPSACPGYGYVRQSLKAHTYVAADDMWRLQVGASQAMGVSPAGNVTIGGWTAGTERLTVTGGIALGNSAGTGAGTMRWTGSDFEGYDGSTWKSFTAGGGSGLPDGDFGQTLRTDGLNWIPTSNLFNDGVYIGIGTTTPSCDLDIRRNENTTLGLSLTNTDPGENSGIRISFNDENGSLAGLSMYDDDNVAYPSQLRLFNNRPGGSLHFISDGGSFVLHTNGYFGINKTAPAARLDMQGGNWDLASTEGDLRIGNDVSRLRIGVAVDGAGAGISRLSSDGLQGRIILGANSVEALTVSAGGVQVTANPGGMGGYLAVRRDTGNEGIVLDGSGLGLGEPRLNVLGSSQSVSFDMAYGGSSSVILPTGAISSSEMQNEPGLVTFTDGISTFSLTSTMSTIGSQTITAPTTGYVLVLASAQFEIQHTNGILSDAIVGVSNTSGVLPSNQDIRVLLQGSIPTGLYAFPAVAHAIFSVSPGANTFYFLGREDGGDIRIYDVQLSCVFIPTTYGTFEPPAAGIAGASDENAPARDAIDVAAQRAASIEADNARIRGELDAMRAELEEVKARIGSR